MFSNDEDADTRIVEVMLIVQVCVLNDSRLFLQPTSIFLVVLISLSRLKLFRFVHLVLMRQK